MFHVEISQNPSLPQQKKWGIHIGWGSLTNKDTSTKIPQNEVNILLCHDIQILENRSWPWKLMDLGEPGFLHQHNLHPAAHNLSTFPLDGYLLRSLQIDSSASSLLTFPSLHRLFCCRSGDRLERFHVFERFEKWSFRSIQQESLPKHILYLYIYIYCQYHALKSTPPRMQSCQIKVLFVWDSRFP